MTSVYLHPTIAAMLSKAEQKLESDTWTPTSDSQSPGRAASQADLIAKLPGLRSFVDALPPGMLEAIGSTSADDINDFLRKRGMSITLPTFGPDDFGVAAVLEALSKWAAPGHKVKVRNNGNLYPAVMMTSRFAVLRAGDSFIVKPDADFEVYMVESRDLSSGLAALAHAVDNKNVLIDIDSVTFPMIDHSGEEDITWLLGLTNGEARISAAVAQAKIRMNEHGIHAKAGAAARATRSESERQVIIDQPFTLAICVGGVPALAFHLTTECWKEPPNLGEATSSNSNGNGKAERW